MIRAVLAAWRHETSADHDRRDRLAFERIAMQAGALFAAGHAARKCHQAHYGGELWSSPRAITIHHHNAARRASHLAMGSPAPSMR
jgi:hypothetical protein